MTISYSTNWMGPVSMDWFRDRGLVKQTKETLTEKSILVQLGIKQAGDVLEYDEIVTHYAGGRIDIYGVPGEHYPLEYAISPMHGEDWNDFSGWLDDFETEDLWELDDLVEQYEQDSSRKIRWAKDLFPARKQHA